MKVKIQYVESPGEELALIRTQALTDSVKSAAEILESDSRMIPVLEEGSTVMCRTGRIYYAESVDKRTFVYTKDRCYESRARLYELEEQLGSGFFRCAKAMIVNIRKIRSVRGEINGRMQAELLNGEKIMISRGYVKDLKDKLGV